MRAVLVRKMEGQGGFSLIEVLISLLILGVGLLGLASLQAVGLQGNHGAYLRSQATLMSYDIVDAMRASPNAALNGRYNRGLEDAIPDAEPTSPIEEQDLDQWLNNLRNLLPEGRGAIDVGNDGRVVITVSWLEDRRGGVDDDEDAAPEQQRREFVYATEI